MLEGNPGNLKYHIGLAFLRISDCVRTEDNGALRNHVRWLMTLARPWVRDVDFGEQCEHCQRGGMPALPSEDMEDEEEYEQLMRIVERLIDVLASKNVIAYTEASREDASHIALGMEGG